MRRPEDQIHRLFQREIDVHQLLAVRLPDLDHRTPVGDQGEKVPVFVPLEAGADASERRIGLRGLAICSFRQRNSNRWTVLTRLD